MLSTDEHAASDHFHPSEHIDLSAESAWALAAEAARAHFPLQAKAITIVEERTKTDFKAPNGTADVGAYSLSDGPGSLPVVRVPFSGRASDVMSVAHEFGHALQFFVTRLPIIPPVVRETAAFLSEQIFLGHIEEVYPEHYETLSKWHLIQGQLHQGPNAKELIRAAAQQGIMPYTYRHNYPLAYAGASQLFDLEDAIAWEVYIGRMPSVFFAARLMIGGNGETLRGRRRYARIGAMLYSALVRNDSKYSESIGNVWEALSEQIPQSDEMEPKAGVSFLGGLGMVTKLLATSPYHRRLPLNTYLRIEILPPLQFGQIRLRLNSDGDPVSFATWAELSPGALEQIIATGRSLNGSEWTPGNRLFFNDFVAEASEIGPLVRELRTDFFPDREATSLRRNLDKSVRRRNRWLGLSRLDEIRKSVYARAK